MSVPALQVEGLQKSFGALPVTHDVSLTLPQGARHAMIGPNGAGKTTLIHLISGLLRPSAGVIRVEGVDVTHLSAERRVALGLARTFQISSLFPKLSVAENIGLALIARTGLDIRPWGRMHRQARIIEEATELLRTFGLLHLARQSIASLAYGQRRLVEIALAFALKPKILLLDEPAAGLPQSDRCLLLDLLLGLPKDLTILVIEHDMSVVFALADRVTVLVGGSILTEGSVADVRNDPRVRDVYLGRRHHG